MNKLFVRSFVLVFFSLIVFCNVSIAQTWIASAATFNVNGYDGTGGTYYRATGGGTATFSTGLSNCNGSTATVQMGSNLFIFKPTVAITGLTINGNSGTGSARTLSNITTATTLAGGYSAVSGASATGNLSGSQATNVCSPSPMVISFGTTIAAGTFIKVTLSGNAYIAAITLTPSCTTPTASTTSGTTAICTGQNTNVSTSNSQSGVTYELYKDAAATGTTQTGTGSALNFSVSPSSTSTYTVRTTTAGGFCATTLTGSAVITVNSLPTISFTVAPATVAVNAQAAYSTQSGQSAYVWGYSGTVNVDYTVDLGGSAADNSVTVTWLTSGAKSVTVNYTNGNGCTATAAAVANTTVNNNLNPPTLSAAVGATVDNNFTITYADAGSPLYSSQITGVAIGATPLTAGTDYDVTTAGVITLKPTGGNPLLTTSGTKSVVVQATGYNDATVSQQITAGAVTQLAVTTQPTAPSVNGAAVAIQPVVSLKDQYNNVSTSNASVTASPTGSTWVIGGTTSVNASSGTATFAGLTAGTSDGSLLAGATITFSIAGPITVLSSAFTIPAYASNATDDFKSKNTNGTWNTAADWLSKPPAGSTWYNSSLIPANTANSITIATGHTMSVATAQTSANLTIETGAELDINSGGTVALGTAKTSTVNGVIKLAGGTYTITGAVTNVDGNTSALTYSSGTLTGASATTLFFKNGGTYNHQANGGTIPTANWTGTPPSTTNITGTVATVPGGLTNNNFYNLVWNCPSQGNTNAVLGSNVAGNFSVASTGSGSGGIQISSGSGVAAVTVGSYTQSGGNVFIFATSGRSLTTNGNFDLSGGSFYVSLNGQGTATSGVNLTVKGNFNQTGGTLSNTVASSTAAVVFNGSTAQTGNFGGTVAGLNITLNNAAGLTLQSNLTVAGTLTLTSGKIHTGSSILTAGASVSGGNSSNYIDGNLQRAVSAGVSTVAFPIGDANNYAPVSLAFGAGNTAGNVTAATAASGVPPSASGINPSKYIKRNWVVTTTIPTPDYAATFTYINPGDVAGANTSALIVAKDNSSSWSNPVVASSVAPTVSTTGGLSSFGTFYLGESGSCTNNTFSGTGNWTDGSKWSCGAPPSTGDAITIAAGANLILNTSFTVGGSLIMNATSSLTLTPTATLSINGTANFNNQAVTFQSDNTGTASLGQVNGTLAGATNVTVERYIPNNGFRSWRLLSVPTYGNGQTIRKAWQEGDANPNAQDNNLPNRGAQITGVFNTQAAAAAAGFDSTSVQAGLLSWNGTGWSNATSTNQPIANNKSWFLYLRGERSKGVTGAVSNSSATTLRTNGTIYTGNQANSVNANSFALIPNVYPSAINFTGLTRTGGVNNLFYTWDSKKLSGNSLGTYQTFSATNSFNCLIAGGSYTLGQPNTTIESGQSFFVTSAAAGTITLKESDKISGTNGSLGFRPSAQPAKIDTRLYNNTGEMLDANAVVFNAAFDKNIGTEDAPKMGNPGANFAVETGNKLLAIEGTVPLADKDVIQFRMWNLQQQTYTLEFMVSNINAEGLTAQLQDSYLKTTTPVSLKNTTAINFEVNNNAGSSAANRFRIIFSKATPVMASTKQGYSIAPNPVENGVINLLFKNQPAGKYTVRILSAAGQPVSTKMIQHAGGNSSQNIGLPAGLSKGTYNVEIVNQAKEKTIQMILVK